MKFYIKKRVYYHDTDCGGVVYYANYLKHLEEARSEYCVHKGIDLKRLSESGIYFVVARIEVDYKSAANYWDILKITAEVKEVRRSSLIFEHQIHKEDKLLVSAKTYWVCVNKEFKPVSIPQEIRKKLQ